jgi:hypothetical protein
LGYGLATRLRAFINPAINMKKANSSSSRYILLFILIVFSAGFLIWGFSYLNGRNLAQPPNFDLSVYDQLGWPQPEELLPNPGGKEELAAEVDTESFVETVKEDLVKKDEEKFLAQSIYFSDFFRGVSDVETNKNITKFLSVFPVLKDYSVTTLGGAFCYTVELPVATRATLKEKLLADPVIASLQVSALGAPKFDLCWKTPVSSEAAQTLVKKYEGVKFIVTETVESKYVAVLTFDSTVPAVSEAITKLKSEYSDVVKITD